MPYRELSTGCVNQDLHDDLDSAKQMSTLADESDEFVETTVSTGKVSASTVWQCSLVVLLVAVVSLTAFCMQNRIRAPAAVMRHSNTGVLPGRNGGHISARQLFESKELADVVTENALAMAPSGNQTLDHRAVHASMVGSLDRVKDMLKREMPRQYSRLGEIMLTRQQQQAVLSAMRRVTDWRVQQLGKEVVATLGSSSGRPGEDLGNAHHRLLEYLQTEHKSIRHLREAIFAPFPVPQDDNWGPADVSANLASSGLLLLDPRGMHVTRRVDGWKETVEVTLPKARRLEFVSANALGAPAQDPGAVHQAGFFFGLLQGFSDRVGLDLDLEKIAKALEQVDFGELLTCVFSKLAALRFQQLAACASQLAAVAMEIFKLFSSAFKSKGPSLGPASSSSVQGGTDLLGDPTGGDGGGEGVAALIDQQEPV